MLSGQQILCLEKFATYKKKNKKKNTHTHCVNMLVKLETVLGRFK